MPAPYEYSFAMTKLDDGRYAVDHWANQVAGNRVFLADAVASALAGRLVQTKVSENQIVVQVLDEPEPTLPEQESIGLVVGAHQAKSGNDYLFWFKNRMLDRISHKCVEKCLNAVYEYPAGSGKLFPVLTNGGRLENLVIMYPARNLIKYPITMITKNGLGTHLIADANDLENMYRALLAAEDVLIDEAAGVKAAMLPAATLKDAKAKCEAYLDD